MKITIEVPDGIEMCSMWNCKNCSLRGILNCKQILKILLFREPEFTKDSSDMIYELELKVEAFEKATLLAQGEIVEVRKNEIERLEKMIFSLTSRVSDLEVKPLPGMPIEVYPGKPVIIGDPIITCDGATTSGNNFVMDGG